MESLYSNMDNDSAQKLIARLAIGGTLVGAVIALAGLYLNIFYISAIGIILILVGMLIMRILFQKSREFLESS
jgi:uncharacterized membrane protein YccC